MYFSNPDTQKHTKDQIYPLNGAFQTTQTNPRADFRI